MSDLPPELPTGWDLRTQTLRDAYWAHREVPNRHRDEMCEDYCFPDIVERWVAASAIDPKRLARALVETGILRADKSGDWTIATVAAHRVSEAYEKGDGMTRAELPMQPTDSEPRSLIAEIRKRVNGDKALHFRKWARDRVNAILDEVEAEAQSDGERWDRIESDLERIEDTVRVIADLRAASRSRADEPRTKAGQEMESWLREPADYEWGKKVTAAIVAIEAEARSEPSRNPERCDFHDRHGSRCVHAALTTHVHECSGRLL